MDHEHQRVYQIARNVCLDTIASFKPVVFLITVRIPQYILGHDQHCLPSYLPLF